MAKLTILLPTYNEETNIAAQIESITKTFGGKDYEIVLADGDSTDRTNEIASGLGARVITYNGRGKARAVAKALTEIESDFAVMLDADLTYPAEDALRVVEALENGAEVVSGSRISGNIEKGSMSRLNLLGNHFLSFSASIFFWRRVSDVCTGLWGFRKSFYKKMAIDSLHFELEANLMAEVSRSRAKYSEIPIKYLKRGGASKLHLWHGIEIFSYIVSRGISNCLHRL